MDSSDPRIAFNQDGLCDYCINFRLNIFPHWQRDLSDSNMLSKLADKIKENTRGSDYDCIIGLSGGLDSSYVTYVAVEKMGLKPLLFHVDAGWNTDQAVGNIEKLVDGLGLDLYTEVINWDEMRDLQTAYFRSQVPDQDTPQDTAFFSALYKFARKNRIKYVLTGANYSTECCREPEEWGAYPGIDKRLILDIHSKFGQGNLKSFPIVDIFVYKILYQKILGMEIVRPLNYVHYNKEDAQIELESRFGWQRFQHKHHESRFTRFFEDYWLPRKFGYDKRRAHFSSLIMTDQMTRDVALERISKPEMSEHFLQQEFEFVASKLELTIADFKDIFHGRNKTYRNYKNKRSAIGLGSKIMRGLGLERRLFR